MVSELQPLKKKEVKKHVATIQCTNNFSLLQRKISNALLFHAYLNLKTVEEHHITVKQLCHSIGYNGNNHLVIKQALKGLIATVIEWDVLDTNTGKEDWTASSILASVHIKGSDCYYAYSPPMRELLYSPSMYAKINLVVQSKFKSNYGLALYENCIRYQGLPHTKWFELKIFKKLMGVPEDTYQIFRDFKRRVLEKALEEVNAYSDLFVQPEIERAGHKVISIRFKLSVREKKKWIGVSLIEQSGGEERDQIFEELTQKLTNQFFLEKEKSTALLKTHGAEYIKDKIKFVEASKAYTNGSVNNLSGYLLDAIKKDYKAPNVADVIYEKNKIHYENEKMQQKLKEERSSLIKNYDNYVFMKNEKAYSSFKEEEKILLINEYEGYLEKKECLVDRSRYKNYGFDSRVVKVSYYRFLRELHADRFSALMSFEDFCDAKQ